MAGIAELLHDNLRHARLWLWAMLDRAIRLVEDDVRFWPAVIAIAAALLGEQTLISGEISTLAHEWTVSPQR